MLPATLYMAVNEIRASAKETGMRFWEYGIDWAFSVSVLHRCSILVGQGYKPNVQRPFYWKIWLLCWVSVSLEQRWVCHSISNPPFRTRSDHWLLAAFSVESRHSLSTPILLHWSVRSVFDRSIAVPVFIDVAGFRLDRFIPIRLRRSTMI